MAKSGVSLCLMITLAWMGPGLRAEEPRHDWSRVQALPADQKIIVWSYKGMGPKVKGVYVSSDAERLIVRKQNGQTVTIPKDRIRLVVGKERQRRAVWVGAAVGFAIIYILGVVAARDLAPEGIVGYGGLGAGIGALVGLVAKSVGKTYVVYQAENQDPRGSRAP